MYLYIYISIYRYLCIYASTYLRIYISICIYVSMYLYLYFSISLYIYISIRRWCIWPALANLRSIYTCDIYNIHTYIYIWYDTAKQVSPYSERSNTVKNLGRYFPPQQSVLPVISSRKNLGRYHSPQQSSTLCDIFSWKTLGGTMFNSLC